MRDAKRHSSVFLTLAICLGLAGCGAASAVGTVLETTADVITAPVDLIVGDDD